MEVPKRGDLPCDGSSGGGLRGAGGCILVGVLWVNEACGAVLAGRGVQVHVLPGDGTDVGEAAGIKVGMEGGLGRINRGSSFFFGGRCSAYAGATEHLCSVYWLYMRLYAGLVK